MTAYGMYPLNQSLAEEIQRLFNKWCASFSSGDSGAEDDVMADFRSNGHGDSEYLPEAGGGANLSSSDISRARRRRSKKVITECVFCKKNGEAESYYTSHTLKTAEGKILCPILRAYTCPICGTSGDNAHTISMTINQLTPLLQQWSFCKELKHPPYSRDLAPCLFCAVKKRLHRHRFARPKGAMAACEGGVICSDGLSGRIKEMAC